MFSFGEQTYRLTARDEETLLVEPFFRTVTITAVGASQTALAVVPIPIDRCLFIKEIHFTGQSYLAPGLWVQNLVQLDARFAGGLITVVRQSSFSAGLVTDNSNGTVIANSEVEIRTTVDTVYPPGMQTIRFQATTPAKAVDATCIYEIAGYLLPPGRIGRR